MSREALLTNVKSWENLAVRWCLRIRNTIRSHSPSRDTDIKNEEVKEDFEIAYGGINFRHNTELQRGFRYDNMMFA